LKGGVPNRGRRNSIRSRGKAQKQKKEKGERKKKKKKKQRRMAILSGGGKRGNMTEEGRKPMGGAGQKT